MTLVRMRSGLGALVGASLLLASGTSSGAGPTLQQCIRTSEDGQDRRREGRLREAEALFDFCSAPSCPSPLRGDCVVRLTETRRAMPTIVFVPVDGRGRPIASIAVAMDGAPLVLRKEDDSYHVDPGEHTFAVSAEGHSTTFKMLRLRAGEQRREEIVLRRTDRSDTPEDLDPTGPLGLSGDTQRVVAYGVGGAGVVGLSLGTYFALQKDEGTGSESAASTGFFVAGVVLVAAGVVLLFTVPTGKRAVASAIAGSRSFLTASW